MTRLAFPFTVTPEGRAATVAEGSPEHIRQMLELLIMTMAGERPMRPDFGSPARQMLFRPAGDAIAAALQATLQATIRQWLGEVLRLGALDVVFEEEAAALRILVEYETLPRHEGGRLELSQELT